MKSACLCYASEVCVRRTHKNVGFECLLVGGNFSKIKKKLKQTRTCACAQRTCCLGCCSEKLRVSASNWRITSRCVWKREGICFYGWAVWIGDSRSGCRILLGELITCASRNHFFLMFILRLICGGVYFSVKCGDSSGEKIAEVHN